METLSSLSDAASRLVFIGGMFVPVLAMALGMCWGDWRRAPGIRRFRCRETGRQVEVTVGGREVRACSAFEPATAINCGRTCCDRAFRR